MARRFSVGLTADGFRDDGASIFGELGLHRLDEADLDWRILPRLVDPIHPLALRGLDAVLAFGHLKFNRELVEATPQLKLVARFGAGYDGIEVGELAAAGVAVTNTPLAVRRPLAMAGITLVLALAHQLLPNHRAVVSDRWVAERGRHRGVGVRGRVMGIVGFGGIGEEICELAQALGFTVITSEHPSARERASARGVRMLPLADLAATSDYVVVTTSLNERTRHLIDAGFMRSMKPTAYIVNMSRGEVIQTDALRQAVLDGTIAGAGLDVYEPEPPSPDDPLLRSDRVVFSPHCLAWTDEFTQAVSTSVIESVVDASLGRRPKHVIDRSVFDAGWRGEH